MPGYNSKLLNDQCSQLQNFGDYFRHQWTDYFKRVQREKYDSLRAQLFFTGFQL